MIDDEPKQCFKCHAALHLSDEMEWPDDGEVPLLCWGCQHEEIRDLVMLARRASGLLKTINFPGKLAAQIDGYLKRHGYRFSILRDEK